MSGGTRKSRPEHAARSVALVIAALACGEAHAQAIHGRVEVQEAGFFSRSDSLDAALGARDRNDLLANARLTWEPRKERWSFQLHYEMSVEVGDNVRLARAQAGILPAPPSTWFDLTDTFIDHDQVVGRQSIDRLAVTYTTPEYVIRVGRQALTWGNGLVFRPMDLFDPFSPNATDTEYKPGADMVYVQHLFTDGSDLQFIVAPRPPTRGAGPTLDASSLALHLHTTLLGHQTTWLLARDHGDWVGGIGVNGALGGATWNLEVVPTVLNGGQARVSALANISTAVTLFHRNATVFAEYFHNGFGVGDDDLAVTTLPPDLRDRLVRGQLFSTRRNYLSAGLTLEANPLLNLSPTLIADLDDASLFLLVSAAWSLSDNLTLIAGAQAPIGPTHTEYGGLPLTPGGDVFVAPPAQIYVQLRRYF